MLWSYDITTTLKLNEVLYLNYNSRYTALTTLGIRQEAEQIMANVFYSTFLNVFLNFCHVSYVFYIFLGTFFYIYAIDTRNNLISHVISVDRIFHSSSFCKHQHSELYNIIMEPSFLEGGPIMYRCCPSVRPSVRLSRATT